MIELKRGKSAVMLWRYLRPFRFRVVALLLLILVSIGLQLAAPQIIRRFLDAAQAGQGMRVLLGTAVIFFLAVLGEKLITLLNVYWSENLGWAATNRLRADLAAHCLRLDMDFHKMHTPGELISRIDSDVSTLAEYFSALVVQIFGNALLLIGILVLLFLEGWRYGLVGLVYFVFTVLFIRAIQKPTVTVWGNIRNGFGKLYGYVEERISGTEDIRANGGEMYVLMGLYPLLAQVNAYRVRAALWGGATFTSSFMAYVLAWVATLVLAGNDYLAGAITVGTVFLLASYVRLLETPVKHIRRQMEGLQRAFASIGRVDEFLQLRPMVQERITAELPTLPLSVTFDKVSFTYKDRTSFGEVQAAAQPAPDSSDPLYQNGRPIVLHGVDFSLAPGRILGILGRTGSGKTTITRLLFRLYDVDAGTIRLGDVDVRNAALSDLRQRVGMVTQDVQLFAATVRDNLTLFNNHDPAAQPISDERILAALHTLGLDVWLAGLPEGLDTPLMGGGQGLSAGQAQLLAFTRVFLRAPQLVVLDEASSRLDPATEQLLERAIDQLLAGRTGIIIAHRLRTVQRADDILILENGRVLEFGPRVELAANPNSRFAHLLRTGLEEVLE